ncbi:hypothetical protein CLOM_g14228, partial [Closterium sp. NIES-68]
LGKRWGAAKSVTSSIFSVNQQRDQRHGLLSRVYTLLQQRRWLWFWSGKWRHFELTKANRWRKECRNSSTC